MELWFWCQQKLFLQPLGDDAAIHWISNIVSHQGMAVTNWYNRLDNAIKTLWQARAMEIPRSHSYSLNVMHLHVIDYCALCRHTHSSVHCGMNLPYGNEDIAHNPFSSNVETEIRSSSSPPLKPPISLSAFVSKRECLSQSSDIALNFSRGLFRVWNWSQTSWPSPISHYTTGWHIRMVKISCWPPMVPAACGLLPWQGGMTSQILKSMLPLFVGCYHSDMSPSSNYRQSW